MTRRLRQATPCAHGAFAEIPHALPADAFPVWSAREMLHPHVNDSLALLTLLPSSPRIHASQSRFRIHPRLESWNTAESKHNQSWLSDGAQQVWQLIGTMLKTPQFPSFQLT